MSAQSQIYCDRNRTGIIPCRGYFLKAGKATPLSKPPFAGATNHRWKYTTGISDTEDDEACEGATAEKARTRRCRPQDRRAKLYTKIWKGIRRLTAAEGSKGWLSTVFSA